MKIGKLMSIASLAVLLTGCGNDPISQIKNSDFCDGSDLSFEDTLSLKYDDSIKWSQFESKDGQDIVEVNAKSKTGSTFRMQYLVQTAASGKIVPKPGYIEVDGKKSNVFGLLFLCM
ncbi:hypothetical protein JKP13_20595 [Vibrio vulnificus]|uniref:hypothetical protein n=1 Tax=Vibrio vulnificus TaxID=672 RepID=UPI001CDBFEE1|nr:hypothetical protein [Vibrio vulnificus]MCA3883138.1 hypothetical protein [Vibrio vulnificus]MCA3949464.1 hypothetical protein [Vibrio vulnificus]